MVRTGLSALLSSTLALGCAGLDSSGEEGAVPEDVKPSDASQLVVQRTQQAHALHYTDHTNLWGEPAFPMGTDNPNCKDWWIYDRYMSTAPAMGWSNFDTYQTKHPWARGSEVDAWMATLPGHYSPAYRSLLIEHNTAVARPGGKCSGRYVFQWDNRADSSRTDAFLPSSYFVLANVPSWLIYGTEAACHARGPSDVPAAMVDLYVCEAPTGTNVGSLSGWCGLNSGHWRKVGSASHLGQWYPTTSTCNAAAGVTYRPPAGKVAVSFNMVLKTGIGHAVAPAQIQIRRY